VFESQVQFAKTKFDAEARFNEVIFKGGANFMAASFCNCYFNGCKFEDSAMFDLVEFSGMCDFERAIFSDEAFFSRATFERGANLGGASCRGDAEFFAVTSDGAFDLSNVTFEFVPNFCQTNFKQAPDFDNVIFPRPLFWRRGDKDLIPKYRAIKRLAIQGHDYEREQMAFKGELRSRCGHVDYRFGLGFWYDLIADCGRSIWRPFLTWLALLLGFAAIYLFNAGVPLVSWADACENAAHTQKWLKAVSLSLSNAVPVIGSSRAEEIRAIYGCLYGSNGAHVGAAQFDISGWSPILQTGQSVLSAVLIFLFLLAIRNQFKIK